LSCDGPKTYHKINLMTMSVNWAPWLNDETIFIRSDSKALYSDVE